MSDFYFLEQEAASSNSNIDNLEMLTEELAEFFITFWGYVGVVLVIISMSTYIALKLYKISSGLVVSFLRMGLILSASVTMIRMVTMISQDMDIALPWWEKIVTVVFLCIVVVILVVLQVSKRARCILSNSKYIPNDKNDCL